LSNTKRDEFARKRCEVVKAEWIFACIEAGRKVDVKPHRAVIVEEKGTLDGYFGRTKGLERGKEMKTPKRVTSPMRTSPRKANKVEVIEID
jgi:hypothetical protein